MVLDLIVSLSAEECFINIVLEGDGMESKVRRLSLHTYYLAYHEDAKTEVPYHVLQISSN